MQIASQTWLIHNRRAKPSEINEDARPFIKNMCFWNVRGFFCFLEKIAVKYEEIPDN